MKLILHLSFALLILLLASSCQLADNRLKGYMGKGPTTFDFTDLYNTSLSTKLESDIIRVSGFPGPQSISIKGYGGALPWELAQARRPNPDQLSVIAQDNSPRSLRFNSNGNKMFMLGNSTDSIYQYSLSTAFDLSTASYDTISFSVATQDTTPQSFSFNSNGTKIYMVGNSTDSIYQYSLSTAFDLSTASYDTISFSVITQDTAPQSLSFNSDGTKMYMVGNITDSIYQYSLSTAFDLSTASYDTINFSVTTQDIFPRSISFNSDGTKMYIVGIFTDSIYQYSLSTAFDLSTASYDTVSFFVMAQDTSPISLSFSSNGTKMFMVGIDTNSIYQYSLSTAFDLSTSSYDSLSFSVINQDTVPFSLSFSSDGTKMFMLGSATGSIYQYSLSTAFDLSTASYDAINFSVTTQDTFPFSLSFNSDGTKMFMVGIDTDSIYQYSLSIAFDLSTASYDTVSFSFASQDGLPLSLSFNSDGTKMYMVGNSTDSIYQYSLSTAFDLSTASYDTLSFSVAAQDTAPVSLSFNSSGTKMFILGNNTGGLYQYSLSTAFDLSTASYDTERFFVRVQDMDPRSLTFNSDGTKMFMVGNSTDSIYQYSLSTTFDLSTASYDTLSFSITAQDISPFSLSFNSDGTKMFMLGDATDSIYQYSLSSAFDLSTASYDSISFSVTAQATAPQSLSFNPDGTKMFIIGYSGNIYQYSLSTAFDLSTGSYDSINFLVAFEESSPTSLNFNNNGTKMFLMGEDNSSIYQYSLSTAFDLSTASYDTLSFSVTAQDSAPQSLSFNSDGTKMFMLGSATDSIYQYSLSTAFDLSTASYDALSFSITSQDTIPRSLRFSSDGTKIFMLGNLTGSIYQYDIGSGGYPEYRICADFQCANVIYDWRRNKSSVINNDDYLQVRLSSSLHSAKENLAVLQFNELTVDWKVTTTP